MSANNQQIFIVQIILLWIYPLSPFWVRLGDSTFQVLAIVKIRVLRYNAADILGQNTPTLPLLSFKKSKPWNLSETPALQPIGCLSYLVYGNVKILTFY